MIVVYPYRKSVSQELEYSIKSVRKHLSDAEIFVIGDDPELFDVTVVKPVEREWSHYSPYSNVISKLLDACELAEEFVMMNDDFFIMDDFKTIPSFNKGTLLEHLNLRRYDTYTRAMRNTRNILRDKAYEELNFEMHTPMVFNSKRLKQAIEELIPRLKSSQSILIRSYYGNRFMIESERTVDVKNSELYQVLSFISTNESTFAGEIGDYIKEKLS